MAVAEKARAEGGRARRWPFFFRKATPSARSLAEASRGKAKDRGGATCMAARKTPGPKAWPIFLPIYRQLDVCDLACGAGRSARPTPPSA